MNQLFVMLQVPLTDSTATSAMPHVTKSISLWDLAMSGGWIMVPILIMSIIAIYIFVERFFAIRHASKLRQYIHGSHP